MQKQANAEVVKVISNSTQQVIAGAPLKWYEKRMCAWLNESLAERRNEWRINMNMKTWNSETRCTENDKKRSGSRHELKLTWKWQWRWHDMKWNEMQWNWRMDEPARRTNEWMKAGLNDERLKRGWREKGANDPMDQWSSEWVSEKENQETKQCKDESANEPINAWIKQKANNWGNGWITTAWINEWINENNPWAEPMRESIKGRIN